MTRGNASLGSSAASAMTERSRKYLVNIKQRAVPPGLKGAEVKHRRESLGNAVRRVWQNFNPSAESGARRCRGSSMSSARPAERKRGQRARSGQLRAPPGRASGALPLPAGPGGAADAGQRGSGEEGQVLLPSLLPSVAARGSGGARAGAAPGGRAGNPRRDFGGTLTSGGRGRRRAGAAR